MPPGMTPVPWMRLPADVPDDFLAELAGQHALPGEIGKRRRHAEDVALADLALEAEQQIGRGEVEEMQRVRLNDLAVVQQATQLLGGRRERPVAGDQVHRLGRRKQVAHRADAAEPLHGDRHFPVRPAFDENLEAAKLDNVEPHLMDPVLLVEQDGDLAVSLDARDRLDRDPAQACAAIPRFRGSALRDP